jgi:hypothetical protein
MLGCLEVLEVVKIIKIYVMSVNCFKLKVGFKKLGFNTMLAFLMFANPITQMLVVLDLIDFWLLNISNADLENK